MREELGAKRSHRITVEDTFAKTLEAMVNKKVVEAVDLAHIQAKAERERIIKVALEELTTKYLASDAFGVIKAGCFLEGFENFWEIAAEAYPDIDFSIFIPDEEEEAEGAEQGEGGDVAAEGAVKETRVAASGEVTL